MSRFHLFFILFSHFSVLKWAWAQRSGHQERLHGGSAALLDGGAALAGGDEHREAPGGLRQPREERCGAQEAHLDASKDLSLLAATT